MKLVKLLKGGKCSLPKNYEWAGKPLKVRRGQTVMLIRKTGRKALIEVFTDFLAGNKVVIPSSWIGQIVETK